MALSLHAIGIVFHTYSAMLVYIQNAHVTASVDRLQQQYVLFIDITYLRILLAFFNNILPIFQHWHLIYFLFKRISLLPYIIMLGLQHFRFVNVTNRDVSNKQRHQYTLVTWYFRQKTFIYAPPFWDWGTRASASLALIRPPS